MIHNLNSGLRGLTAAFVSGNLAEGTNANTIKTVTNTIVYCIDGQLYTKAPTDNIAMTACAQQAANTTCLYTISINASGTVTITKGDEVATADLSAGKVKLEWPEPPASQAVIGGMKIATTVAFTSGSTDLGAAGVTDTFYNFASLPASVVTA